MPKMGEVLKERRIQRMRLGQSTFTEAHLLTDDEIKFAIVPLTEAEYQKSLDIAAQVDAPDNAVGMILREERQKAEILAMACREIDDLSVRVWGSGKELAEFVDTPDMNHLWDLYLETTAQISPSVLGLSQEDFDELKKALQEMDWNALSGKQWYAAERFLLSISPTPLLGSKLGSSSTKQPTTTSDESEPMNNASGD